MKEPKIVHLVEAALYAADLGLAEIFYRETLALPLLVREPPRHLFFQAGSGMLLIFQPVETIRSAHLPPHGAAGPGHVALGIEMADVALWKERFAARGVAVEQEVQWPRGGLSLYVRDPSGNVVELITKGCWGLPNGW